MRKPKHAFDSIKSIDSLYTNLNETRKALGSNKLSPAAFANVAAEIHKPQGLSDRDVSMVSKWYIKKSRGMKP